MLLDFAPCETNWIALWQIGLPVVLILACTQETHIPFTEKNALMYTLEQDAKPDCNSQCLPSDEPVFEDSLLVFFKGPDIKQARTFTFSLSQFTKAQQQAYPRRAQAAMFVLMLNTAHFATASDIQCSLLFVLSFIWLGHGSFSEQTSATRFLFISVTQFVHVKQVSKIIQSLK